MIGEAVKDMNADVVAKWKTKANFDRVLTGLLPLLETSGHIRAQNKSVAMSGGRTAAFVSYNLTPKASHWLHGCNQGPLKSMLLPVPPAVRLLEEERKAKSDKLKQELIADKIDISLVPKEVFEGEEEDGASKDWLQWHRALKRDRATGFESRAVAKETLLSRVLQWRAETAVSLRMSPEAVLSESLARRISYTQMSSVEGLRAIGLRSSDASVRALSDLICSSLVELGLAVPSVPNCADNRRMIFANTLQVAKCKQILNIAVKGKSKHPVWEESLQKFNGGVAMQAIATLHSKGIKVSTVLSHLFDAYKLGNELNIWQLAEQARALSMGPPSKSEWDALQQAASSLDIAPEVNEKYLAKTLLQAVPQVAVFVREGTDSSTLAEADRFFVSQWYSFVRWWHLLRVTRTDVSFEE